MADTSETVDIYQDDSVSVARVVTDDATHILVRSKKSGGMRIAISALGTGFIISGSVSGRFSFFVDDNGDPRIAFTPKKT